MPKLAVVAAGLLLVSCANQAEIARQQRTAEVAQCLDYGFERGTPEFGMCRMRVAEMWQHRQLTEDVAVMGLAGSLYGNGGALAFQPSRPVTCYQMGIVTRCQ